MTQSQIHPRKSWDFQAAPSFNWTQQAQGPCSFGDPCVFVAPSFWRFDCGSKLFPFHRKMMENVSSKVCPFSYQWLVFVKRLWLTGRSNRTMRPSYPHTNTYNWAYLSVYWDGIPKQLLWNPQIGRFEPWVSFSFLGDDFCSRSTSTGPSTFRTLSVTLRV